MVAQIIERQPFDEYKALPDVHATALRYMLVSPLAYRHHVDAPDAETDAMRIGRAVHTACLEPLQFLREYVLWTGERRAGRAWEEFRSEHAGRTILRDRDYELALRCQEAVQSHPIAGPMLAGTGRSEVSIRWQHPRTGVGIKCRIDRLTDSLLIDLKTSRDPSPRRFSTQAGQFGYALQLALYADAVVAAGLGTRAVKIVAVQSVQPHDVVVYDVPTSELAAGVQQYEEALDRYVQCSRSGSWPGMAPAEEVPFRLPLWAAPDFDEESPDQSAPIADAAF